MMTIRIIWCHLLRKYIVVIKWESIEWFFKLFFSWLSLWNQPWPTNNKQRDNEKYNGRNINNNNNNEKHLEDRRKNNSGYTSTTTTYVNNNNAEKIDIFFLFWQPKIYNQTDWRWWIIRHTGHNLLLFTHTHTHLLYAFFVWMILGATLHFIFIFTTIFFSFVNLSFHHNHEIPLQLSLFFLSLYSELTLCILEMQIFFLNH